MTGLRKKKPWREKGVAARDCQIGQAHRSQITTHRFRPSSLLLPPSLLSPPIMHDGNAIHSCSPVLFEGRKFIGLVCFCRPRHRLFFPSNPSHSFSSNVSRMSPQGTSHAHAILHKLTISHRIIQPTSIQIVVPCQPLKTQAARLFRDIRNGLNHFATLAFPSQFRINEKVYRGITISNPPSRRFYHRPEGSLPFKSIIFFSLQGVCSGKKWANAIILLFPNSPCCRMTKASRSDLESKIRSKVFRYWSSGMAVS